MVNSLHDRLQVELAHGRWINSLALAELWLAIGDRTQAREQVLAAYRNAWVDGEPYVWRYELNKACALLEKRGEPTPKLAPYDSAKEKKFPWEVELVAAEKLRAKKKAAGDTLASS